LKPWATTTIINSIRQRNRLHLHVKKHPLNLKLKDYYLKFRKKITKIIKNAKIFYYKAELLKAGNNSKLKWQTINNILAINKSIKFHEVIIIFLPLSYSIYFNIDVFIT